GGDFPGGGSLRNCFRHVWHRRRGTAGAPARFAFLFQPAPRPGHKFSGVDSTDRRAGPGGLRAGWLCFLEDGFVPDPGRVPGGDRGRKTGRELATAADAAGFRRNFVDRKSTRLNSSHVAISYAVFCLKKKKKVIYSVLNTR